ncbi:1-acyl-sn-glycerol-3-phosphate acyltransferase [Candidatus Woesearchaeota archaeon]|nr:1-acyl-sn-glycerol-3-phosphate acyltransferase [Candidatus Woesearchaeota archaeon]
MAKQLVHRISRRTIFPLVRKLFNFNIKGLERVQPGKTYIFAANHQGALDLLALSAIIVPHTNRHLSILTHRNWYYLFYPLFRRWKAVKVNPSNEGGGGAIEKGAELLNKGHNALIFPEASEVGVLRNELLRAFTGVIRLAILSKKTIIPVGIKGSHRAWKFPHPILPQLNNQLLKDPLSLFYFNFSHLVQITFGEEISFSRYYAIDLNKKTEKNRKLLRRLVTELMVKIGKLAGQPYKHDLQYIK